MMIFSWNRRKQIKTSDIVNFFRQLSTLISAGLSLMKSLDIIMQTTDKYNFRSLVRALKIELESGKEFNRCLRHHPCFFDLFSCQLVQIGEQSGTLDLMLARISIYKENKQKLKKQLQQALFYPFLLLITALVSTLMLLLFVIPQFASLYEHFPNKIPALTQAVLKLSSKLQSLAPGSCMLSLLLSFFIFHFRHSTLIKTHLQALTLKLPGLRDFVIKIFMINFSRNLASMLSAAIPLSEALIMVSQLSPFEKLRRAILKVQAGVNSGKSLYSNLQLNPLFPPLLVHMSRIGEESGSLDLMLEKFAKICETEFDQWINALRLLLEPLIIALLGVLIGGIVIAMYLPIFHLGTVIS